MDNALITVRMPIIRRGHGKTEDLYFECGLCPKGEQRFHLHGGAIVKRCDHGHTYTIDYMTSFGNLEAVFLR